MRIIAVVATACLVVAVFGCGQHEDEFHQNIVDLTDKPPEVAYVALKCAKCHGSELEGQRTAPKLTGLAKRWAEEDLFNYLRDPKTVQAETPRLAYMAEKYPIEMPAYPSTDEEVLRGLNSWILEQ